MLTFDCPPSGAICWAFPGTPALPSPSSLLAPRAAPTSALSGAVPLGTPLGLSVSQSPVRPRGSLVAAPCRALGGPTQRSERPEAPCREQVSLLLQLLTCSSVRAAGRTLRLRNSCNGVGLGRLGAQQGHACPRHRKRPGGALGLLPVPAASPLSGSGQFSDLNCRSAPLAPARTPDWSFSLANLGNMPTF